MGHDARRVARYLSRELPAGESEAFEAHLVSCDHCWLAVSQDRHGRELAESLRELAPAGLGDRIRMAAELAAPPARRRRRRARLAALATVALVAAGGVGVGALRRPAPDAAQVAAVIRAAGEADPPASVVAGGQPVVLSRHLLDGRRVTVGRAAAFPMPEGARRLGTGPRAPWVVERGGRTVVCLSRAQDLLVVAAVPADRLVAWARALPVPAVAG